MIQALERFDDAVARLRDADRAFALASEQLALVTRVFHLVRGTERASAIVARAADVGQSRATEKRLAVLSAENEVRAAALALDEVAP